ncbi:MAG: methyl-accepting chemotaxis protein [bacterium]|nr:methyl-accepting chemotaxis protein [bacterium]
MSREEGMKKRKKYFIQRLFQTKFIILFLFLVILGSIISGGLLYKRTSVDLGNSYSEAHSKLKTTGELILPNVLIGNIVAIIIIGVATVALTVIISHRVAGPLYRFEKTTEQIAQGDLTIVTRLRQYDQVKSLADALSRMTMELREKILDIRKKSEELPLLLDEMKALSQKKTVSSEELTSIMNRLSRISSSLQQSLEHFKL